MGTSLFVVEGMSKGDVAQLDAAARVIQQAWRRYTNMEPYKWCRNMLFHAQNSGDPQAILRLVSPHDTRECLPDLVKDSSVGKDTAPYCQFRIS